MALNDLELVSQFCNNPEDPLLFTLPIQFCKYNVVCAVLKSPVNISIISIFATMAAFWVIFMTWYITRKHVATKFITLSENERIEYMLKIARDIDRRTQMERSLERDTLACAGAPAQFGAEKEPQLEASPTVTL
ncbi:hypothetical protein N431DRAFT_475171 [Stipitochalara longipes BDJ]|nr:hypothetical protein N431DRAFT_475171 [Stipitochalara longipes BDJ]